jgi:hypothetical protein
MIAVVLLTLMPADNTSKSSEGGADSRNWVCDCQSEPGNSIGDDGKNANAWSDLN